MIELLPISHEVLYGLTLRHLAFGKNPLEVWCEYAFCKRFSR